MAREVHDVGLPPEGVSVRFCSKHMALLLLSLRAAVSQSQWLTSQVVLRTMHEGVSET